MPRIAAMYLHGTWEKSLQSMHYRYKHIHVFTHHLRKVKDNQRSLQKRKNTGYTEGNLSHYQAFVS